jgi:hypothetical protein
MVIASYVPLKSVFEVNTVPSPIARVSNSTLDRDIDVLIDLSLRLAKL